MRAKKTTNADVSQALREAKLDAIKALRQMTRDEHTYICALRVKAAEILLCYHFDEFN